MYDAFGLFVDSAWRARAKTAEVVSPVSDTQAAIDAAAGASPRGHRTAGWATGWSTGP